MCLDSSTLNGSDHYLPLFHHHSFLWYIASILVFTPKILLLLICLCIQAPVYMCTQLCPTLCDPMDCSPPGSSVHGIFHASILEWTAISYSRGSSRPRDWTCMSCIPCIWQMDSLLLCSFRHLVESFSHLVESRSFFPSVPQNNGFLWPELHTCSGMIF